MHLIRPESHLGAARLTMARAGKYRWPLLWFTPAAGAAVEPAATPGANH